MCTQVPMKIVRLLGDHRAIVRDENGNERTISLELLGCATLGDYVTYRNGYALRKFDPQEAQEIIALVVKLADIISLSPAAVPQPQLAFAF